MTDVTPDQAISLTQRWLEKAVIGLNLCPFAKSVHVKGQIRYRYSGAATMEALAEDLLSELRQLATASPAEVDTTLVIHPHVLQDFLDYNEFLGLADAIVEDAGLEGVIQVASFHPDYRFADSAGENDVTNYTNRSPFPMLHLLRESSVTRAVTDYPDTDRIYEDNIRKLKALGLEGWEALWR